MTLVIATAVAGLLAIRPPTAVPASAPEDRFSAERALRYVQAISSEPRPTGSAANQRVRNSLVQWLGELGLDTDVQQTAAVERPFSSWVRGARLTNVVGRLAGTDPTGTVLLMSHHDTVPLSPGAADSASGVAAVLETLRAMQAGQPPRNDVVVLFTDAEEIGLFGAEAFLERHPWAEDVKVVLNLEARGSGGPSILFETGPVDAAWMRRVAAAAPVVGASYAYDVYRYLPNNTDFTVFKQAGLPGFNFAFIGDFASYHSARDDLQRLDPASLQHHGASTLGLALELAAADLARLPQRGSAIYFNLPGVGLVAYPTWWALPMAVAGLLGLLVLLGLALRRRALRPRPLMAALGLVPLAVAAGGAAVHLAGLLWESILGIRSAMLGPTPWYLVGWVLLAVAVTTLVLAALSRRPGALHLAAAACAWWALLALGAAVVLPSSSYLFAWPLLFALLPLALLTRRSPVPENALRDEAPQAGIGATALLVLAPVPAILLWTPTLALLGTALGSDGAAILAVAGALLAALLVPGWLPQDSGWRWALPLAASAAAVVLLVHATLTAGYGPDRPRPDSLYYALDTESGEALWVSEDRAADAWTEPYLVSGQRRPLEGFFFRDPEVLAAPAPRLALPGATVEALETAAAAGELLVRVVPPSETGEIRVALSAEGGVELLRLDGQPVEPSSDGPQADVLEVSFFAPPAQGLDLLVARQPGAALEVEIVAHRYSLPRLANGPVPPRPAGLQPSRFNTTDRTLVRSRTVLTKPAAQPADAAAATQGNASALQPPAAASAGRPALP